MVNRTGIGRSIMIIIASLAVAASACGAPPAAQPQTVGTDQSLEQADPTSQPGGGASNDAGGGGGGGGGGNSGGSGGGGSGGSGGGGGGGTGGSGGGSTATPTPGGGSTGGSGGTTTPPTSGVNCLYGKWSQQTGKWMLPGSSWGLSGTVTVNYASSTADTKWNVILFERNSDVGRNTYTEDLQANYMQGYGNPQPSLTLTGRDYGDFSVSGSTLTFSNGSTIQMVYRMDTAPVSTKNTKRLVTTAEFTCSSTTLEISSSQFTATYKRLY